MGRRLREIRKMTEGQLLLLREWIRAEIDYAIARNQVEEDEHAFNAKCAEKIADTMFNNIQTAFAAKPN